VSSGTVKAGGLFGEALYCGAVEGGAFAAAPEAVGFRSFGAAHFDAFQTRREPRTSSLLRSAFASAVGGNSKARSLTKGALLKAA